MIGLFLFTLMAGLTIGGLLAAPKERIKLLQFIFFVIFFMVLCYIGMIMGMFFSGWLSVRLLEFMITIAALVFIVACVTRFHPTFGFFHPGDYTLLVLMASLFFLMGLEWGLYDLRAFFTITSSILFAASLLAGAIIQLFIKQSFWRYSYTAMAPLIWLLIISFFKLL